MAAATDKVPTAADLEWVTVKTTLPSIPYPLIPETKTERLLLRPHRESDVDEMHIMRTQPEVMTWTMQGRPDTDIEASRKVLNGYIESRDVSLTTAICDVETGQLLGSAGIKATGGELGWPVLGYMFRREAWGKGYATEFLKAFLGAWWSIPREEAEIKVVKETVRGDAQDGAVPECLEAMVEETNKGSLRVATKCGFQVSKIFEVEETSGKSPTVILHGFTTTKPPSV